MGIGRGACVCLHVSTCQTGARPSISISREAPSLSPQPAPSRARAQDKCASSLPSKEPSETIGGCGLSVQCHDARHTEPLRPRFGQVCSHKPLNLHMPTWSESTYVVEPRLARGQLRRRRSAGVGRAGEGHALRVGDQVETASKVDELHALLAPALGPLRLPVRAQRVAEWNRCG